MKRVEQIEEIVILDKRLGRHIEHDPKSKAYGFGMLMTFAQLKSAHHRRYGKVLNQGDLGSCTGNATAHCLNTAPFHKQGTKTFTEDNAVAFYKTATALDDIPGSFPPEDTGSSGLAVAKAAKQAGLISGYKHAFSLMEALTALQFKPVITGIDWYEGFDSPDAAGNVSISGQVRGGHEICIIAFEVGYTLDDSILVCQNSWGLTWGRHGQFQMKVKDFNSLLGYGGDVTIFDKVK